MREKTTLYKIGYSLGVMFPGEPFNQILDRFISKDFKDYVPTEGSEELLANNK